RLHQLRPARPGQLAMPLTGIRRLRELLPFTLTYTALSQYSSWSRGNSPCTLFAPIRAVTFHFGSPVTVFPAGPIFAASRRNGGVRSLSISSSSSDTSL